MPRLPLHPSSGTGIVTNFKKSIRFVRYGCTNRPFYHIVVIDTKLGQRMAPIEQLGSYDPIPNKYNEKLVSFNFERIQYWLGQQVSVSKPVAELLGLAGFFPIHPRTYMKAWRNRKARENSKVNEEEKQAVTN
ncbi:probable 28S ribosomal protein S16, mitochondrial [Vespa mandarinia]|uniref:probable 28S ribosomal protein S16, mitochondrial n=1 Tax=Vespa mandarinia TaxID=7446 RepID=UPI00160CEC72|nr:probable 28S ribosomal protein S16, mitochondrial [Vespa mandarinia]XP_035741067.1 probable 28S ribosomal protein S16, mitochondrial [Vespa mandarinia]XP_046833336.1 probable 28S ribosomal protein S16, mitochondrial [Vespa crabro]XP_046833337.1 probable 28S ribosomal protein S16, mitochondrial [Vespa crabro]